MGAHDFQKGTEVKERTTLEMDGTLALPSWVIDKAQLQPGDDLSISPIAPGVVQLRKASPWDTLSPEEIEMRIRQVLMGASIDTRDKTNEVVREVRREMAAERPPSQTRRGSSRRRLGKQQPYASGWRSIWRSISAMRKGRLRR